MTDIVLNQPVVPGDALDTAKVFVRSTWNGLWFRVDDVYWYVDWLTWSVSGMQIDRAQLTYRYGQGMRSGEADFGNVSRIDAGSVDDYFIKIEIGGDGTGSDNLPWLWVGQVQQIGDILQGRGGSSLAPAGEQKILCYGMEYLLEQSKVLTSEVETTYQGTRKTVERGITFNHKGRGNRSIVRYSTTIGTHTPPFHYIFGFDDGTSAVFNQKWSTRDIVEYLISTQAPISTLNSSSPVYWDIETADLDLLPEYDAPEVPANNRRLIDLLDNLITRERFLTWWTEYDEDYDANGNDRILIRVATFTDSDIMRPAPNDTEVLIPANPNVDTLSLEDDPAADGVVYTHNKLDQVDEVIVQGARRTSTFTLNEDADGTLARGWTQAEQDLYDDGAKNRPDYDPNRLMDARQKNHEVRSKDELAKVYTEVKIVEGWDYLAGDGQAIGEKQPVFPDRTDPQVPVEIYLKEAYFAQNLSLLKGRDYSGTNISDGTFREHDLLPQEPLKPIALAPNPRYEGQSPSSMKYLYVDRLGRFSEMANQAQGWSTERFVAEEFSVRVRILPDSTNILLEVVGEENQHVIAKNQFAGVGNPVLEGLFGPIKWDWREFILTVTLVEDRFAEARYPATVPLVDSVRTLVVDAGESYRKDYVVPGTVVGLNDDREIVRTTLGGYVVDDQEKMDQLAQAAYQWYSKPRTNIEFETVFRKPADDIQLGNYIKTVNTSGNQQAVDAIVTEIRIRHSEVSASDTPQNAIMSVKTGFAEVDPASFLATFQ